MEEEAEPNGEHQIGEAGSLVVPPLPSFGPFRQLWVTFWAFIDLLWLIGIGQGWNGHSNVFRRAPIGEKAGPQVVPPPQNNVPHCNTLIQNWWPLQNLLSSTEGVRASLAILKKNGLNWQSVTHNTDNHILSTFRTMTVVWMNSWWMNSWCTSLAPHPIQAHFTCDTFNNVVASEAELEKLTKHC